MLPERSEVSKVGNYRLYDLIGVGGMGSVHLGRLYAAGGFRRFVAIKRLHPHLAANAEFVGAFLDEARLASRIHHPNVIAPLDVVAKDGEALLVFEYVDGVSLATASAQVAKRGESIPSRIIVSLMVDVLNGLQAAHEATGSNGEPLGLIHRDVSPQNVLVGREGTARLLDFGIAKAAGRSQNTDEGIVKGKRGYMAPEHLLGQSTRACDIYSAGVVLYELLMLRRLFSDDAVLTDRISGVPVVWPSDAAGVDPLLRAAAQKALAPDPAARFGSAGEMSAALEAVGIASSREVAEWLQRVAGDALQKRAAVVARAEAASDSLEALPIAAVSDAAPAVSFTEIMPRVVAAPKRSTWLYPVAAAVALLLVAASALIFVGRTSAPVDNREAAGEAAATVAPPPSVAATAEARPADSSTATAAASAPEPAAPSATTSPARGPAPKSRPAALARGACNPYVLDKDGRTHFNEACLRRSVPAGR